MTPDPRNPCAAPLISRPASQPFHSVAVISAMMACVVSPGTGSVGPKGTYAQHEDEQAAQGDASTESVCDEGRDALEAELGDVDEA